MEKVINIINLIGWSSVLLSVGLNLFVDPLAFMTADITLFLRILQVTQLLQISDILVALFGKTQGSLVGAFFQILGRNIVSLLFMSDETHHIKFALVAIIWSIADINRYLYYIFKDSFLTGFLRYNGFLLLYPLGITGEMFVINDFLSRNP